MKLQPLGTNETEVELTGCIKVLFSYKTPVAAVVTDYETGAVSYYRTSYKWSVTTSKHINKWFANMLGGFTVEEKEQSFFDDIVEPK